MNYFCKMFRHRCLTVSEMRLMVFWGWLYKRLQKIIDYGDLIDITDPLVIRQMFESLQCLVFRKTIVSKIAEEKPLQRPASREPAACFKEVPYFGWTVLKPFSQIHFSVRSYGISRTDQYCHVHSGVFFKVCCIHLTMFLWKN